MYNGIEKRIAIISIHTNQNPFTIINAAMLSIPHN